MQPGAERADERVTTRRLRLLGVRQAARVEPQQIVQSIANGETGQDIFGFLKITAPVFLNGMLVVDEKEKRVTGVVTPDQLAMFCAADPILSQATQFPRFRDAIRELLDEVRFATMGEGDEQLEES